MLVATHKAAFQRYRPARQTSAQLLYFLCTDTPIGPEDCTRDWRRHVATPPDYFLLPGVHGGFHAPPQRSLLLDALDAYWMPEPGAAHAEADAAYAEGSPARLPANLLQAHPDHFGAHTYQRIDREGTFHTDWLAKRRTPKP